MNTGTIFTDLSVPSSEIVLDIFKTLKREPGTRIFEHADTKNYLILLSHFFIYEKKRDLYKKLYNNPGLKFIMAWDKFPDYIMNYSDRVDRSIDRIIDTRLHVLDMWKHVKHLESTEPTYKQNPLLFDTKTPFQKTHNSISIQSNDLYTSNPTDVVDKIVWLYATQTKYQLHYKTGHSIIEIFDDETEIPILQPVKKTDDIFKHLVTDNYVEGISRGELFVPSHTKIKVTNFYEGVVSLLDSYVCRGYITDNMIKLFWSLSSDPIVKDKLLSILAGVPIVLSQKLVNLPKDIQDMITGALAQKNFALEDIQKLLTIKTERDETAFRELLASFLLNVPSNLFDQKKTYSKQGDIELSDTSSWEHIANTQGISKRLITQIFNYNPWVVDMTLISNSMKVAHTDTDFTNYIREYNSWQLIFATTKDIQIIHRNAYITVPNKLEIIIQTYPDFEYDKTIIKWELDNILTDLHFDNPENDNIISEIYKYKMTLYNFSHTLNVLCGDKINNIEAVISYIIKTKKFTLMKIFKDFFLMHKKLVLEKIKLVEHGSRDYKTIKEILNI